LEDDEMNQHFQHVSAEVETYHFKTVRIGLSGRYMVESRQEYTCQTVEISTNEMSLIAATKPRIDEEVIVYFRELCRLNGRVVSHETDGFRIGMNLPSMKRKRLEDQLTLFALRRPAESAEKRRHERIVPVRRLALLRLSDGCEHIVKIRDVSMSGVSIESKFAPVMGSEIVVDDKPAVVVRHFDGGLAAEFIEPCAAAEIDGLPRL